MTARVLLCRSNGIDPDPRVEKIAGTLTRAGYPVTILGWDRSAALPTPTRLGEAALHRLPIRAEFGAGLHNLPNLLHWQAGLLGWLVHHRREYDLIHACDFDTVLPTLLCARLFRKRLVYDIFDFYADHLRRTPAPVKRAIRALDLGVIRQADAVILVDDARREQIAGAEPRRLAAIYNTPPDLSPDPDTVPAAPRGTLHLVYVGLLQVERGLFELFDVLARHPGWTLDLAGFGGDAEILAARAAALPNITCHGRIPYEKALALSAAADVLFATYDPTIPNHRYSSPNKVFEAMMLGKPILVAQGTNMDQMIETAQCGLVVPYGDAAALESALARLEADPTLREALGANARRAYEQVYSWEKMEERLLALYADVLKTP